MARFHKFSSEFIAQVVLEVLSGTKTGAQACREYGIRSQLLSKRKAQFLENAASAFKAPPDAHTEDKARIADRYLHTPLLQIIGATHGRKFFALDRVKNGWLIISPRGETYHLCSIIS